MNPPESNESRPIAYPENWGPVAARPLKREADLIIESVEDEVLVYDLRSHRAHRLNRTCAAIWNACDGKRDLTQLGNHAAGEGLDTDTLWLGLDQLQAADLLEQAPERPATVSRIGRREAARRLALGGVAAALVPIITSIVAPTAAEAGSCLNSGSACTAGTQCCSGICTALQCV